MSSKEHLEFENGVRKVFQQNPDPPEDLAERYGALRICKGRTVRTVFQQNPDPPEESLTLYRIGHLQKDSRMMCAARRSKKRTRPAPELTPPALNSLLDVRK